MSDELELELEARAAEQLELEARAAKQLEPEALEAALNKTFRKLVEELRAYRELQERIDARTQRRAYAEYLKLHPQKPRLGAGRFFW